MAVFYIIEQKKKREQAKRNEAMIRFINSMESMDKNYVSTSTWSVTNRYPAKPHLTKQEVWDIAKQMYDEGDLSQADFTEVGKLLDLNKIDQAIRIIR